MVINVSVQYNGGLLPGITCIYSLSSHLNVLAFFTLTGGCSEGLDAFRCFLKHISVLQFFVPGFPITIGLTTIPEYESIRHKCRVETNQSRKYKVLCSVIIG